MGMINNRIRTEIVSFLLSFVYLCAAGYGIIHSLMRIAKLDCETEPLAAALILFAVLFTALWRGPKWLRGLSGVFLVAILLRGIYLAEQMKNGFLYLSDFLISAVNRYFGTSYYIVYFMEERPEDLILILLAVIYIILALLSICVVCSPNIFSYLLISAPVIGGGFLIGVVPEAVPMLFWMFAGLLVLFRVLVNRRVAKNKKNRVTVRGSLRVTAIKSECVLALSTIVLFGMLAWAKEPLADAHITLSKQTRDEVYSNITQHIWSRLRNWKPEAFKGAQSVASGGINEGELGNIDRFVFNGEEALKVTVSAKPKESIYLKGYVGSEYTGQKWTDPIRTEYDTRFITATSGSGDTEEIQNLLFDICDREIKKRHKKSKGLVQMQIEWKAADKKYTFLPYIADQKELEANDFKRMQDSYIKNKNLSSASYQLTYYPMASYRKIQNANLDAYDTPLGALESDYSSYVHETYLQIPKSGIAKLKEEFKDNTFEDLEEASEFIRQTLHERTKYNLNVGKLPAGNDFADYFLYEQKEGSCTHYATTAALMFRLFEIPSRYAIGYIVSPSDFQKNKDGTYTAVIKDNKAHAWAEVYIDGFGWMPQEMTPGYGMETSDLPTEETEDQMVDLESRKKAESSPSTPVAPQPKQTDSTTEGEHNWRDSTSYHILLFLAGLILLIFFIKIRRWWVLKRRRKSFRGKDYNENIRKIYAAMEDIYAFLGVSPKMGAIKSLLLEAQYSNHTLSEGDCKKVEDYYHHLRKGVRENIGFIKKLKFQYWNCLD